MKVYYYQIKDDVTEEITVGNVLWIGNEGIRILTILKVDFYDKAILFHGVSENELNL